MENNNINNCNFRIYNSIYPKINESVVVVFINRKENHFEGKLIEYGDIPVIMSYNDATKKKKVKSWNAIVPLNKPLLARIEEVNEDSEWIHVSIAYNLHVKEDEDELKFYNNNNSLVSLINKVCINNQLDFNKFWSDVIHGIDRKRCENLESDELELDLCEYFNTNLELYEEIIKTKYENHEDIIKSTHNSIVKKVYKIISKVGIISMSGITKTIEMFKKLTEENSDWEYSIKYESTPFYIIESLSNNSSNEHHEELITRLNILSKEYKIFIKVEFIGKKQDK